MVRRDAVIRMGDADRIDRREETAEDEGEAEDHGRLRQDGKAEGRCRQAGRDCAGHQPAIIPIGQPAGRDLEREPAEDGGRDIGGDGGGGDALRLRVGRDKAVEGTARQARRRAAREGDGRNPAQLTQAQRWGAGQSGSRRAGERDGDQRQAEQGGRQREELVAPGSGQIDQELPEAEGRVCGDHVDREDEAPVLRDCRGIQPALGGDEEAGAAEAGQEPDADPCTGRREDGL